MKIKPVVYIGCNECLVMPVLLAGLMLPLSLVFIPIGNSAEPSLLGGAFLSLLVTLIITVRISKRAKFYDNMIVVEYIFKKRLKMKNAVIKLTFDQIIEFRFTENTWVPYGSDTATVHYKNSEGVKKKIIIEVLFLGNSKRLKKYMLLLKDNGVKVRHTYP